MFAVTFFVWALRQGCHYRSVMPPFHDVAESTVCDDINIILHSHTVQFHLYGCHFSREEGDGHYPRPSVEVGEFHRNLQLLYVVRVDVTCGVTGFRELVHSVPDFIPNII